MNIIVTGGAGLIGSHAAEFYAQQSHDNVVHIIDNLSRSQLMGKDVPYAFYNWEYLKKNYVNIVLHQADIRDAKYIEMAIKSIQPDIVIHAAGQPGVPTSVARPEYDFTNNVLGTFNILEAIRKTECDPALVYCSTNKVYGENVNYEAVDKLSTRYRFRFLKDGISEDKSIDLTKRTPYGTSKLCGDLYCQEYANTYGLRTGIFRMSCIYGERQLGVEEQGWVAHFIISALHNKKINIFGDGLQVRDLLYVKDLIKAYNQFAKHASKLKGEVFNMGGGRDFTMSLIEMIKLLAYKLNREIEVEYKDWRPSDQVVYISDIAKAVDMLNWEPTTKPSDGIEKVIDWVMEEILNEKKI
jgi:CDP-paratose 2-epimerase